MERKTKEFLMVGLLLSLIIAFPAAASDGNSSLEVVTGLWSRIQNIPSTAPVAEKEAFISAVLKQHYDFEEFYRTALQDHWSSLSGSQKSDFASRFETLFIDNLKQYVSKIFRKGITLKGGIIQRGDDRAEQLFTVIKGADSGDFRVFLVRKGDQWKIYDVEVEGVLTSRNYRAQFNRTIRNEGFEGLLVRFDKKLKERGEKI